MTVREIFEQSSNVGVSKIITSLFDNNPEAFVDHLRQMSLGKPLGIEIKGETPPIMKDPRDKKYWSGTSLPWMSIGYELTITPLQTLTFYNSIANNGVMVKPIFVSEIRQGGETIKKFDPVVINPAVCTPATLQLARSLLEGVVSNGTGRILKDSTYKIAGKTGTALIAEGAKGYTEKNYNASFVGYFPADNPKYSCIIVVNRPEAGKYYGAAVAAPVFKEIANKVYATQLDIHDQDDKKYSSEKFLPAAAKGDYKDLKACMSAMTYAVRQPSQNPEWVTMDSSVIGMIMQPSYYGTDTIPDLAGLRAKDAVFMLEKAGLFPVIHGKGIVYSQSLPAGTPLVKGSEIILTLENPVR
jgi:cell division protein FtsI (penicillin-binding protein 3)